MKKAMILALAMLLALSMLACGKQKTDPIADPTAEPTTEPTEELTPEPTEEPTPEPTEELKKETGIVGSWTLMTMERDGASYNAADLGVSMTFAFGEDGKVAITAYGETNTDAYTFVDNEIVVSEPAGDVTGAYDPVTDTIWFEKDGVKLTLVRTESLPETEATEEPAAAYTKADIVGTWSLTSAKTMGITVPADQLDFEMRFTFNEDGIASMLYNGETFEGLSWDLIGNIVRLSAYGVDLYDFTFDGITLTLHENSENVDMFFEKN